MKSQNDKYFSGIRLKSWWMTSVVFFAELTGGLANDCNYATYCPNMLACVNSTSSSWRQSRNHSIVRNTVLKTNLTSPTWDECCDELYDPGLFPYNNDVCKTDCPPVCNGTDPSSSTGTNGPSTSGPEVDSWLPWVLGFGVPITAGFSLLFCCFRRKQKETDTRLTAVEGNYQIMDEKVAEHDGKLALHLGGNQQAVVVGVEGDKGKINYGSAEENSDSEDEDKEKKRNSASRRAFYDKNKRKQQKSQAVRKVAVEEESETQKDEVFSPSTNSSSFGNSGSLP